jgi:HSP20 family protein
MQERIELQEIPVRVYSAGDRLTIAAPMPGLQPEDISVEVSQDQMIVLHGELRGVFKDQKDVLLSEWNIGGYHREMQLPFPVDASTANVTYGNGVLVIVLPIAEQIRPARLTLADAGRSRGQHVGHTGSNLDSKTTEEHQAAMANQHRQSEPSGD